MSLSRMIDDVLSLAILTDDISLYKLKDCSLEIL